ncbi:unnamed protein product [Alternaria alternata]
MAPPTNTHNFPHATPKSRSFKPPCPSQHLLAVDARTHNRPSFPKLAVHYRIAVHQLQTAAWSFHPPQAPHSETPNARGKVLLSPPGHSPLDWAYLQKSGKNLSGVDSMIRVTPAMLKEKNGRKAGKDGTKLFMEVHPWVNWENMLGEVWWASCVSEEQAPSDSGGLEDMD